jgi:hypothetical protein
MPRDGKSTSTPEERRVRGIMNIVISFPSQGQIRLQSRELFTEPGNEICRHLLERVFQATEITDVTINRLQPMTGVGPVPRGGKRARWREDVPPYHVGIREVALTGSYLLLIIPASLFTPLGDGILISWPNTFPEHYLRFLMCKCMLKPGHEYCTNV